MAFLILTDCENQAVAQTIAQGLKLKNFAVTLLDLSQIAEQASYAFSFGSDQFPQFKLPRWQQQALAWHNFDLVCGFYGAAWPEPAFVSCQDGQADAERQAHIKSLLSGIHEQIPAPEAWCNPDAALASQHQVVRQAQLARQAGFRQVASLIGNDSQAIKEFIQACGGKVYCKNLPANYVASAQACVLSAAQCELDAALFYSPAWYQQIVALSFSARVVVVGEFMLAFKLASELGNLQVSSDFPQFANAATISIAAELQEMIQRFRLQSGLDIFTLDFVIDQRQQWYFIAISPNFLVTIGEANPALGLPGQVVNYLIGRALQSQVSKPQQILQ